MGIAKLAMKKALKNDQRLDTSLSKHLVLFSLEDQEKYDGGISNYAWSEDSGWRDILTVNFSISWKVLYLFSPQYIRSFVHLYISK